MTIANIKSKKPYYVTKDGLVFNHKRELKTGSYDKKHNLHILSYIDENGDERKIPFTKLIYSSFYPKISLAKSTITRINKKVENQYSLYNLHKVSNEDLGKNTQIGGEKNRRVHRTFFYSFSEIEMLELKKDLSDKFKILLELSKKYEVSTTSISRARKKLVIIANTKL